MNLWARKACAYVTSTFLAFLAVQFFARAAGGVSFDIGRDSVISLIGSLSLWMGSCAAFFLLAAFLYSRLAPRDATLPAPKRTRHATRACVGVPTSERRLGSTSRPA